MSLYVDIEKKLGNFLLQVKFEAKDEAVALLGASGCGKSMTLKCIAGIETPDKGRIVLNDRVLFDHEKKINIPTGKRRGGYLFQNGALFPNMTVLKNVMCGIRKKCSDTEKEAIALEMLDRMKMKGTEKMLPAMLSGGQQQRAALARILVNEPEILMLDEPFSALDSHLRFELEQVLSQVIKDLGKTAILVSHNRDEAFRITEKLVIMNNGRIEVYGDKKEVFAAPLTRNAAILTGCKNVAKAAISADGVAEIPEWGISLKIPKDHAVMTLNAYNAIHSDNKNRTANAVTSVETGSCDPFDNISYIGVRMHDILPGHGENEQALAVSSVIENPFSYTVMLSAGEECRAIGMELDKPSWEKLRDDRITVRIPSEAILLLRDD
ncbi:MAG: ATP-binding cassette domain-containing protein [Lachnospiraceae bacterium]|nr:ATP-binding cassette domain-containing protein [Lachnospiraceae bacterium]